MLIFSGKELVRKVSQVCKEPLIPSIGNLNENRGLSLLKKLFELLLKGQITVNKLKDFKKLFVWTWFIFSNKLSEHNYLNGCSLLVFSPDSFGRIRDLLKQPLHKVTAKWFLLQPLWALFTCDKTILRLRGILTWSARWSPCVCLEHSKVMNASWTACPSWNRQ